MKQLRVSFTQKCHDFQRSLSPIRSRKNQRLPVLVAVETDTTVQSTNGGWSKVAYRAKLKMGTHSWVTEPFNLDELLAVVVSARKAEVSHRVAHAMDKAKRSMRKRQEEIRAELMRRRREVPRWRDRLRELWRISKLTAVLKLLKFVVCFMLVFACVERTCSYMWHIANGEFTTISAAWWMAPATASVMMFVAALAGITEMSFLPTKAFLQLERKDETGQVEVQLNLLLHGSECLRNMDVCTFLNLGMATYHGTSETQKEGRCFCRRHDASEYFMRARRRRWALLGFSCDCRCRFSGWTDLQQRWLVLRKDGLALFQSVMDQDPIDMLFFDTHFSLFRDDEDRVLVCGASWVLELSFRSSDMQDNVRSWCNAITLTAQVSSRTREQRYGSFAPIRYPSVQKPEDEHMFRCNMARFIVNGAATFRKIGEAIKLARHEIFILGWMIQPHLPLFRNGDAGDARLSKLLGDAADRGVRVYVLLYHEQAPFLPNDSEWAETELSRPNVYVVRHRSRFDINRLWSHHEKVVVVDQQLAFVGGLDLAFGRFDDHHHRVSDSPPGTWHGQDYSNLRTCDIANIRQMTDILDRERQARLPWHDVSCSLLGRSANDLARHCVERWNHAKVKRPQYATFPNVILRPRSTLCNPSLLTLAREEGDASTPCAYGPWQDVTTQIIRSVGQWSAGARVESSTHTAICELVQESERFVYIENQFFCSGMDGDEKLGNRVVEAIYRRILQAHTLKKQFHIMMVLPLLPALDGAIAQTNTSSPLMYVMKWQYRTLRTLRERLAEEGANMSDYFSVFGMRTHGTLNGKLVTEQIYVHSKILLVDDRWVIVGSANLNDRSLLGMRDSEVCVVLRDTSDSEGFAAGLRRALFSQLLGLDPEELESDPVSLSFRESIAEIARTNTRIYEELFAVLPSDEVRTWSDLAARRGGVPHAGDSLREPSAAEAQVRLPLLQGRIVEYPLDFLLEEDLAPSFFAAGALTPDAFN